jgi:hypothetical protein
MSCGAAANLDTYADENGELTIVLCDDCEYSEWATCTFCCTEVDYNDLRHFSYGLPDGEKECEAVCLDCQAEVEGDLYGED